jgi:DNA-binding XRE family transcriptional regulator
MLNISRGKNMSDEGIEIVINFDSCWQNGFLEGEDALEVKRKKLVPKVRKFFATSESDQSTDKSLTKNTVLGVLCRLIGDQRKLYDARQADDYYFKNVEDAISFSYDDGRKAFDEKVIVVNKSDNRCAQSTYLGVIPDNCHLFSSPYAKNLWHVLDLSVDKVCDYLNQDLISETPMGEISLNNILNRIREIQPLKKLEFTETILDRSKQTIAKLEQEISDLDKNDKKYQSQLTKKTDLIEVFKTKISELCKNDSLNSLDAALKEAKSKYPKLENKGGVYPMALYGAALYLTARTLRDKRLVNFLSEKNKLAGFAEESYSFNGIRDFLNPLAGGYKKTVRTPADISKHSGKLVINVRQPIDTADLVKRIEYAGVSSFYLGKKGLAYVEDIRI